MVDMTARICPNNPTHKLKKLKSGEECTTCKVKAVALTPELIYARRLMDRLVKESPRPGGTEDMACEIEFVLCATCGAPVWQGTQPLKEEGAENRLVLDQALQQKGVLCRACQGFKFREPEVFNWVMQTAFWRNNTDAIVANVQKMTASKKPEPKKKPPRKGKGKGKGGEPTNGKGRGGK
jgi:hypothetical protein